MVSLTGGRSLISNRSKKYNRINHLGVTMKHNVNGFSVVWNKSYDRHTNEGILVATRSRADGTREVIRSCVDDSINTFVTMLKRK